VAGVTAHGGPGGPLQFDRPGSHPGPPDSPLHQRVVNRLDRIEPSVWRGFVIGSSHSVRLSKSCKLVPAKGSGARLGRVIKYIQAMQCWHDGTNKCDANLHNPLCRKHLLDLLGCAMRDKLGFRDNLRVIRESQKRVENPPAKPVETEPKITVMDWIRNGYRFPEKGAK
jgi:hypothetical protein